MNRIIKIRNDETKIVSIKKNEERFIQERLTEGKKMSILSDSMFRAMFGNIERIKYSAKLISYIIDLSYEEVLENIMPCNTVLDKNKVRIKDVIMLLN